MTKQQREMQQLASLLDLVGEFFPGERDDLVRRMARQLSQVVKAELIRQLEPKAGGGSAAIQAVYGE